MLDISTDNKSKTWVGFQERLNAWLDQLGAPKTRRAAWLYNELELPIDPRQANRFLQGDGVSPLKAVETIEQIIAVTGVNQEPKAITAWLLLGEPLAEPGQSVGYSVDGMAELMLELVDAGVIEAERNLGVGDMKGTDYLRHFPAEELERIVSTLMAIGEERSEHLLIHELYVTRRRLEREGKWKSKD